MKFVIKDLIKVNEEVAHLYLSCVTTELVKNITTKENYDFNTTEVDMKLYIENTEVDVSRFMNTLMDNYYKLINKRATKLLKEQLSQKAIDIADTLENLKNKLECLEDTVSWDENLLK